MKKHEIRRAVDKAARKHMPEVIASVARGRAYEAVHAAMVDDPDGDGDAPTASAPRAPMSPAEHAAAKIGGKR